MVTGYFGLPGAGKTTFLAMIARRENRRIKRGKSPYDKVLTNFCCKDCYKVNFKDIGTYDIHNCLILLDEVTLDADSRDFKQFSQSSKYGFLYHRHYFNDIIYFTQDWSAVDKKIRDITHTLYYVKKPLLWPFSLFSRARRIFRTVEINEYTKDIVNGYRFPSIFECILSFLGLLKLGQLCFRPLYYKDFDSYEQPRQLQTFILGTPWEVIPKPKKHFNLKKFLRKLKK